MIRNDKLRVALNIGHYFKKPVWDSGAINRTHNITEWEYNRSLVFDHLEQKFLYNTEVDIIPISAPWSTLPNAVNKTNADLCISFHCNAFNGNATGTETLYFKYSEKGKQIAQLFQTNIVATLGLPNRGIKDRTSADRGGALLQKTNMPCIILEPFFIDNNTDLAVGLEKKAELANMYYHLITEKVKPILERL